MSIKKDVLLEELDSLPRISSTVVKLNEAMADHTVDGNDIAMLVAGDPGLAAEVLRIANTVEFGTVHRIDSIEHAVAYIGTQRVFRVAMAAGMSHILPEKLPGYGIGAAEFARHSSTVGLIAQQLADMLDLKFRYNIFTAGLLHDCGKLALGAHLEISTSDIAEKAHTLGCSEIEVERDLLGTDHAELGGMLLNKWDLPDELGSAARWHHAPSHMPEHCDSKWVQLIHVANFLAHSFGHGTDKHYQTQILDHHAKSDLGIQPKLVEYVIADTVDEARVLGRVCEEAIQKRAPSV